MSGVIPLIPLTAVMAWTGIIFYFYHSTIQSYFCPHSCTLNTQCPQHSASLLTSSVALYLSVKSPANSRADGHTVTVTQSYRHSHTGTQSHSHTATVTQAHSHSHTVTQVHSHTGTVTQPQSHRYTVTQAHCHTVQPNPLLTLQILEC
jgi:hypothetical protein